MTSAKTMKEKPKNPKFSEDSGLSQQLHLPEENGKGIFAMNSIIISLKRNFFATNPRRLQDG